MVLHFIAGLLNAGRAEQERFFGRQIPQGVFGVHQAEIRWIYEYRNRNGIYPSVTAFQARFNKIELPVVDEPLDALVETIVNYDLFNQVSQMVDQGRALHTSGRDIKDVAEFFRRQSAALQLYDTSFIDSTLDGAEALKNYRLFLKSQQAGEIQQPSPWATLNRLITLFLPGELAIIAARVALGKTWTSLYWAEYFASQGERVLFISKELPTRQVTTRWIALRYRLSYAQMRKGALSPRAMGRWARAVRKSADQSNVLISGHDTLRGVGFNQIFQKVQEFAPTVLVVDGAYLIYPEERFASDVQRIAFISSTLKRLSMAYSLKVIAVVQVKREAEPVTMAGVTKANLVHIYGSDTWAQDADVVVIINGRRGATVRTMSVEKAREGENGEWTVNFKLHPYPDFSEVDTGRPIENKVQFVGV